MAIIARSTSTLPSATKISANSFIQISQVDGNYYDSLKIKYSDMFNQISSGTDIGIAARYNLTATTGSPLNIRGYADEVNRILYGDKVFSGTKTFNNGVVFNSPGTSDTNAVNRLQVKQLISQRGHVTSSDTVTDGFPLDVDGFPKEPGDSPNFIRLGVDKDNTNLNETTETVIADSGQLVMWGWLADTGVVQPELAWVGLFAKMAAYGDSWMPLQIQPWILGKYSSILQYVSFNIPITGPIKVKIRTGFRMNINQSGFQNIGSKTYRVNRPCSFFGYVLKS